MRKCNLCYDRTSLGRGPMCATVCPTQAIFYGTYEEWLRAGRAEQGAQPVNVFWFGAQRVRTRNYVIMTDESETLDLLAMAEAATLGRDTAPAPTADRNFIPWETAEAAGAPQREIPAHPWEPRIAPSTPGKPVEPATPLTPPVPTAPAQPVKR